MLALTKVMFGIGRADLDASLVLVPGLASVGRGPDFRRGSYDSPVLRIGKLQVENVAGQVDTAPRRLDTHPIRARVRRMVQLALGSPRPHIRSVGRNRAEDDGLFLRVCLVLGHLGP